VPWLTIPLLQCSSQDQLQQDEDQDQDRKISVSRPRPRSRELHIRLLCPPPFLFRLPLLLHPYFAHSIPFPPLFFPSPVKFSDEVWSASCDARREETTASRKSWRGPNTLGPRPTVTRIDNGHEIFSHDLTRRCRHTTRYVRHYSRRLKRRPFVRAQARRHLVPLVVSKVGADASYGSRKHVCPQRVAPADDLVPRVPWVVCCRAQPCVSDR